MRFVSTFRDGARVLRIAAARVMTAGLLACGVQAGAQDVFRVATDLVVLQVTVTDGRQRYVGDLAPEDFRVFEEGVPQTISMFAAGRAPLDVTLALDTSASMYARLPTLRRAAIDLVQQLGPDDRAAVLHFDHRVRIAQPLSGDRARVVEAIRDATAAGGTALYEAIYIGLQELGRVRRGDERRRQALVVFSDGDDNGSHVSFEDVLELARRQTATIYTLVPPIHALFDAAGQPLSPFAMKRLADETGGRAFAPARLEDLTTAYRDIAEELRHQYLLAYAPVSTPTGFRRVAVHVMNHAALRARTRSGYYAPREADTTRRERATKVPKWN